jgi:hypothetical protein
MFKFGVTVCHPEVGGFKSYSLQSWQPYFSSGGNGISSEETQCVASWSVHVHHHSDVHSQYGLK